MSEIKQLPEVVDFAGKIVVMPGVLDRLWCIYEFAWTVECNGGNLVYGYTQGGIDLDAQLAAQVEQLYQSDRQLLKQEHTDITKNTRAFFERASCFSKDDETFIKETIQ